MFVTFNAETRLLTSTADAADSDGYREIMSQQDQPWTEAISLPAPYDQCFVDEDGVVQVAEPMPLPEGFGDQVLDAETPMADIPGLPEHAVITPEPGTLLTSGTTHFSILAVGYVPVYGNITVITAEDRRSALVAYARNRRWELEQLGAPYRGLSLATDDRCKLLLQSTITGADLLIKAGLATVATWSTKWTFLDGKFVVRRGDLDEMTLALMGYVSALFSLCDRIEDGIGSGSIQTNAAVDATYAEAMKPIEKTA